jgi:hypothetical protein
MPLLQFSRSFAMMIQEMIAAVGDNNRHEYYVRLQDGGWQIYSFREEKNLLLAQTPQNIDGEIVRFPVLGLAKLYAQFLKLKAAVCESPTPCFLAEISPAPLSDRIILANRRCRSLMGGEILGFSVRDFLVTAPELEKMSVFWRSLQACSTADFFSPITNLDGQIIAAGLRSRGHFLGDIAYAIIEISNVAKEKTNGDI